MTVANMLLRAQEAALLTDTLKVTADKWPLCWTEKCYVLARLPAAFAVRGYTHTKMRLQFEVQQRYLRTTEDIAALTGAVLAEDEQANEHPSECLLAGYSTSRQRFVGFYIGHRNGYVPLPLGDGVIGLPHPVDLPLGQMRGGPTVALDGLRRVALAQRQADDAVNDGNRAPVLGGQLVLTHLQRSAVVQKVVHQFADYAALERMMEGRSHAIAAE